jgi:SRSO17 transposase
MEFKWMAAQRQRLGEFFQDVGELLGTNGRRISFTKYAMGLLGEAERKSMEPMAVQFDPCVHGADAAHQRLQQFITDSNWDDVAVRAYAAKMAVAAMTKHDTIRAWIIDDTGFLKQGRHSVGVQRQYTGSAGKITNCQTATSLVIATSSWHAAIDFALYLPKSWTDDPQRRREARIPDDVVFKTKPQQAIEMIHRAVAQGIPPGVILADAAYGDAHLFRHQIRALNLHYAVGVEGQTKAWLTDKDADCAWDKRTSLTAIAKQLAPQRQLVTWREGTKQSLSSTFALTRVTPAPRTQTKKTISEPVSLLIEWQANESGDKPRVKFYFISQPNLTLEDMVHLVKERYRTEQVYAELKGALGLDHFEGRRYRGWNHHVSVVLACQLFVVAERALFLPPRPSVNSQRLAPVPDLSVTSRIPLLPFDLPSLAPLHRNFCLAAQAAINHQPSPKSESPNIHIS